MVAGPNTSEIEINLKKYSRLCSVSQTMSSAMHQDAPRTLGVYEGFWADDHPL